MVIKIPLSKRSKKYRGLYETTIDDIDSWALSHNWNVSNNGVAMYAGRYNGRLLHREIMAKMLGRPLEKGEMVDHANRNPLDNRRENLRLATSTQNKANSKTYSNNKLGYKGVYKYFNRYKASIRHNNKTVHIGAFDTPEEAHAAYLAKAQELFGEFANGGES